MNGKRQPENDPRLTETETAQARSTIPRLSDRLCGSSCGCTPGSAFGLLTGLGIAVLRFIPRTKRRDRR